MDQETAQTLLEEAVGKTPASVAPADTAPARADAAARTIPRRRKGRIGRSCLFTALALLLLLGLGTGLAVLRLSQGPLRIEGMSERVADGIAGSIGPGWRVNLRDSALELDSENALALRVAGLDVYNPEGALVVRAPMAVVSLDTWGLLRFSVKPRSIEFRDLAMTALVHDDGSIAFAASSPSQDGAKGEVAKPHTLPSVDPARGSVSPLSAAVASIFGVVLDSAGVVGALDRARIIGARLTLIDDDARQRAVFERVNALFQRDAARDARLFELRIDGPHGEWRFGGTLHEAGGGRRTGTITLDDLPVTDMLLLSGQSKLPVETDLKLSAKADVAIRAGRIETMKAEVHSSPGNLLIEEKDFNPVAIETLRAEASWDEAQRAMKLDDLTFSGGGNAVRLEGAWAQSPPGSGSAWTLGLSGRDATLRGATPKDAPVRIAEIKSQLTGREGGISIDELAMRGEKLNGSITGTIGTSRDEDGITLSVKADHMDGRLALRLWPEHVAPAVRNYFVDYLIGGQVDSTQMLIDMSGAEMAEALTGAPMPDKALHIDVAVSEGMLTVSRDAPPIRHARVTGLITGRSTTMSGASAKIKLSDTLVLALTEGAFSVREPQPDKVVAQIGLKLGGGADALAALLQTKMFKGLTGAEIDPATVKGRADLRIDFPLNLKHVPDLADLPVTLSGALTELSVDKAFGKERFEAGRFALSYDRGGFAMKGDGKVLGAPLTIDLKQPKPGAPGEAVIALVMDEAFRARKGLPSAPQLSGPVPARVVVPVGRPGPGKAPVRIEADLTRAAIDGVLPGWTKAAGKPGKLALTMVETGAGGLMELRDIALDAAPVSARGSATISAEGGFERAEMTSVKLSPGDDMRVSAERSGTTYKVAVKGAVADARPFLKGMNGGDSKKGKDKDTNPKEVEADVAVNILTGFNGEAITGASLKLALRGGDIRSAQMKGRIGAAPITASIKSERAGPLLSLDTTDSGATLRFFDVYKRMYGGKLDLDVFLNDGPQAGVVKITNFVLRDEPALSRIVASAPEATDGRGRRVVTANDVGFDRMRANFTRDGARVSFTDAAISNAAMGFTLGGWLDTAKERTQIDGTFVPLYALNNVVSQVPIIGQILGGDRNEGLIGMRFAVSGPIAKPTVSVNPLSIVAPGFLRQLFGAGGGWEGSRGGEAFAGPDR